MYGQEFIISVDAELFRNDVLRVNRTRGQSIVIHDKLAEKAYTVVLVTNDMSESIDASYFDDKTEWVKLGEAPEVLVLTLK